MVGGFVGPLLGGAVVLASAVGCSSSNSGSGPGASGLGPLASATALAPLFASLTAAPEASESPVAACTLLTQDDVLAVASTFKQTTITIDGQNQHTNPPTNDCEFNQKGTWTSDGITSSSSGDNWAEVTVITGGADYAYQPGSNDKIPGLGDGAYWDPGTHTVVILKGRDVLQVVDEVPVNQTVYQDLVAVSRQAAQDLAAKILARM